MTVWVTSSDIAINTLFVLHCIDLPDLYCTDPSVISRYVIRKMSYRVIALMLAHLEWHLIYCTASHLVQCNALQCLSYIIHFMPQHDIYHLF